MSDLPQTDEPGHAHAQARLPGLLTSALSFFDTDVDVDSTDTSRVDDLLEGLNPEQRQAVIHEGGPLLIIAGAGSGKTKVLTHRIAYLLATGRARPGQILAITFTNKAAAEMRERVESLVGPAARYMWVSTFHSACVRILRREATNVGMKSSFTIYDAADSLRLMTIVARRLDLDPKRFSPRSLLNRVSSLKNELIDDESYASSVDADNEHHPDSVLARAYREYQSRLRQANALDFDDIIMTTVNLLQAFPQIAEHYRRRFRHIMVDEYQDTNHAQYTLIRELVGQAGDSIPPGELTVVGDADQSIYAFRGATIRNIEEFEKDFPHAKTIMLEQNYRSTQTILTAANSVISQNPGRHPKRLWSESGAGEQIVGYVGDDEHEEARFVTDEIDRLTDAHEATPGDVAVFYRTNAQSRAFEEVLIRVGLPYRIVGGTRFYERREIKDAIAYLHAVANPDDLVSVRRILNVPKRGIGDKAEEAIAALAERERISFSAAMDRVDDTGLAPRSITAVKKFVTMMKGLTDLNASGVGPAEILDAVLDRSGYLEELRESSDPQDETRVENLAELLAVAREFEQLAPEGTLDDFLEQVSLVADSDQIPDSDNGGVVTLMTLHTAKGLEFPVVFLTGLEDGTFPHQRSMADESELAEERRLAYVGITRARQRLYISRAAVRSAWGRPMEYPPSRFLEEIPSELIDWRRRESSAFVARKETGQRFESRVKSQQSTSTVRRHDRSKITVIELEAGDKVTHDTYGVGTVVEVEGSGRSAIAKIDFPHEGVKRLLLRYSPVTKL